MFSQFILKPYAQKSFTFLIFNKFSAQFAHKFNQEYLQKLQVILKQKFEFNDQIIYQKDVRLIDANNKLIGIFSMEEAKRRAMLQNIDIVMINSDVTPAISKLINYSEELGQKFLKEVISTEQEKREKSLNKQTKVIKLGSKITLQDLKLKAKQSKDLLKKAKQIKAQILCDESEVEQSRNVIITFKDMTREFLTPQGEIIVRDYEPSERIYKKKEDEQEPKKHVEWLLRSVEVQFQKQDEYSITDLKRFIDLYYNQTKTEKYAVSTEDIQQAKQQQQEDVINIKQDDQLDYEAELLGQFKKNTKKSKKSKQTDQEILSQRQFYSKLGLGDSIINLDNEQNEFQRAEQLDGQDGINRLLFKALDEDQKFYHRLDQITLDIINKKKI